MWWGRRLFSRRKLHMIDKTRLPAHIGVIMDGNGRWAKKRGLPRSAGHQAGANNLKKIVEFCNDLGIRYMTVYAFSTENWKRPKQEVDALMDLLLNYLRDLDKLAGKNVVVRVIGDRSRLSEEINREIDKVQSFTKENTGLTLNIALNYGGRDEIVTSVQSIARRVAEGALTPEDITAAEIAAGLYTAGQPNPDLIIRPSGEYRLSNFLMWQSAYAELWFSNINWPDFSTADMTAAIVDYQNRDRRFGGVKA